MCVNRINERGSPADVTMLGTRANSITMFFPQLLFVFALLIVTSFGLPAKSHRGTHGVPIPPKAHHQGVFGKDYNAKKIAERIESWTPEEKENAWEWSGLFEGDIMLADPTKNGLLDETTRWPGGVVPFYIDEEDFDQEQIKRIKAAVAEYHQKTCLRFRPYKETDEDYLIIEGSESGCWSSVGRRGKGQVLNLQPVGCMKHGTIVHEMMHAVGFYHQQSSYDRDDFVKIYWENIKEGKENNFNKYDKNTVTDYGISYDYGSVMHYSGFAFSKNGERTIMPLQEHAEIGQRMGLSEKDITKLQAMYKEECGDRKPEGDVDKKEEESLIDSLGWLFD